MKKQSGRYPKVFYEKWKTPISEIRYIKLHLSGLLQTITQAHFFFEVYGYKSKKIYVMTIPRGAPYQLVEEGISDAYIGKYFMPKGPYKPYKRGKGRPRKTCSTWKLWNTNFVQKISKSSALSHYKKEKKMICEYLVETTDEWITFVSCPPTWKIHRNIKIEKLVQLYIKEGFQEQLK